MIPTNPVQYLKEHIGCKWSVAMHEKHLRTWSKSPVLTEQDTRNFNINMCQELENEITLESDYKDSEIHLNKENQDYAENILKQNGAGYYVSSHGGKSDYIRFRFKTSQKITPQLRLQIIRYLSKPNLKFDEAFFSIKFVRPVPNRPHWKHTYQIEKVIKIVEGQDLDIDFLGIKEPIKPIKMVHSGSVGFVNVENQEPKGWALSINIKSMAQRYNLLNCPKCNNPFEFNERLGRYNCQGCKAFGNLKGFSKLIILRSARQ